jgi:hypothetical protein
MTPDGPSERTRPGLAFYYDPDRRGRQFVDFNFCGVVFEFNDPDDADAGIIRTRTLVADPRLGRTWVGRTGRFLVVLLPDRCSDEVVRRVEREFGIRGEIRTPVPAPAPVLRPEPRRITTVSRGD